MSDWYAPNQQAVHVGAIGPACDEPREEPPGPAAGTYTYTETGGDSGRIVARAAAGQVLMDGVQWQPTAITISLVDVSGNDQSARFPRVVAGTVVRFDQLDNPACWQEYVAREPFVMDADSGRLDSPVHWNQGDLLADGADVSIIGREMTADEKARWETQR